MEGSRREAYAVDTAGVARAGSRAGIVERKKEEVVMLRGEKNSKGWLTREC